MDRLVEGGLYVSRAELVKNALISAGINPVYYRALLGHKLNEKDMDELYGRGGIEKMREAYETAIRKGVFTIVTPPPTLEELQRRVGRMVHGWSTDGP